MGLSPRILLYASLFVAAFALPVVAVWGYSAWYNEVSEEAPGEERNFDFKPALAIRNDLQSVVAPVPEMGNPQPERDFFLMVWFRTRKVKETGGRQVFLTKVETESGARTGYGLGYVRLDDVVKPQVYWVDEQGKGGWYEFLGLSAEPKEWIFLGLTRYGEKYLGLYGAVYPNVGLDPEVKLLGGYELEEVGSVANSGLFTAGAHRNADLRLDFAHIIADTVKRDPQLDWGDFFRKFVDRPDETVTRLTQDGQVDIVLREGQLISTKPSDTATEGRGPQLTAPEAARNS